MPAEPIKMDGKWFTENEAGEWAETAAPVNSADSQKPLVPQKPVIPELSTAAKVQRAIRDFSLPITPGAVFPPLGIAETIKQFTTGEKPPTFDMPVGTGSLRSILTGVGGALGMTGAGALAAPTGPGALATGAAGYAGGAGVGSLLGQAAEKYAPNLFKSGYAPETGANEPTDIGLGNTAEDVIVSAVSDLVTAGLGKGANLFKGKGRADLAEWLLTRKYDPARKNAMPSPISSEKLAAINANPDIPLTMRDVLPSTSLATQVQEITRAGATDTAAKAKIAAIFRKADELTHRTLASGPEALVLPPGALTTQALGKRGLREIDTFEKAADTAIRQTYTDLENLGGTFTPPPRVEVGKKPAGFNQPIPTKIVRDEPIQGPIKLAGYNAEFATRGKELRRIISEIPDKVLAADLSLELARLDIGQSAGLKSWKAVHEAEIALGRLASDKNTPKSVRAAISSLDQILQTDIERNLSGKIADTAEYWKAGALNKYNTAKQLVQSKYDALPKDVTGAITDAAGEVLARPGERGGAAAELYDKITRSPEHATRMAKVAGKANTATAFLHGFLGKYTNQNTKQIAGGAALAELESENTKLVSESLLNSTQRASLKQLLRLSSAGTPVTRLGQLMFERDEANAVFHGTGAAVNAITEGKLAGAIKPMARAAVLMGTAPFAETFLLNNQFARRVANSIGKPVTRPGMAQELVQTLKLVTGPRLLIQSAGKAWLFNTKTKELTEVPPSR